MPRHSLGYRFRYPTIGGHSNIKSFPIISRTRVDGDKIKLKTGTKSVSNFLTDKKVPYMQRKDTLVLCDEFDNILYILGYITR